MYTLQRLRTNPLLTGRVLLLFALALLASIASPMLRQQTVQLICTDGGAVRMVMLADDGQTVELAQHALECPACLPASLPPAPLRVVLPAPQPPGLVQPPPASDPVAVQAGAPLPPRGPPAHA